MVLLLNVRMSKNKSIKKFDPKQRTSDQIVAKVVPSIMKLEDFLCQTRSFIGKQGLSKNLLPL